MKRAAYLGDVSTPTVAVDEKTSYVTVDFTVEMMRLDRGNKRVFMRSLLFLVLVCGVLGVSCASGTATPVSIPTAVMPTPVLISPEEAVEAAIEGLEYEDIHMRMEAMRTLAELDPEVVVPALLEVLKETEDVRVRSDVVGVLVRIGPVEGVVPALIDTLLNDEDRTVRGHAASVLGRRIGAEEGVIPALVRAMEEDPRARWAVTEGLVVIGPEAEEAVPSLMQAALGGCSSEGEAVCEIERNAIFRTLQAITGQDFGDDASAWQEWWETHGR